MLGSGAGLPGLESWLGIGIIMGIIMVLTS